MNFLTANVALEVDHKNLEAQLAKAKTATTKAATKMETAFKKMGKGVDKVFKAIAKRAKWAGLAIAGSLVVIGKAAMKQQDALFLLDAALKISGEYTEELSQDFRDFASEIQQTTIYGDEFILSLMQQQKSLGVVASSLKEGAKMAIGLSTATGQGIESMSRYVALAMQGEFTMLRRYIPALRATTDRTKQLAIVTKFAADGFKLAEERAQTASGRLKQLWNTLGDVAEIFGAPLLEPLARWADKLKIYLEDNKNAIIAWTTETARAIKKWGDNTFKGIPDKLKNIWGWTEKWKDELLLIGKVLITLAIVSWATPLISVLKALTAATWGLGTSFAALGTAIIYQQSVLRGFVIISGSWIVGIKSYFGLLSIKLTALTPLLSKIGVVGAGAFAAWGIYRVVDSFITLNKETKKAEKAIESLDRLQMRYAIKRRLEAEGLLGDSPLVKAAKEFDAYIKSKMPARQVTVSDSAFVSREDQYEADKKASAAMQTMWASAKGLSAELRRKRDIIEYTSLAAIAYAGSIDGATAAVKRYKDALDMKDNLAESMDMAQEQIEFLREMGDLSLDEKIANIDAQMEALRELYGYQTEAEKLLADERKRYMEENIQGWDAIGRAITAWGTNAANWGKQTGEILTKAFDTAADNAASALMGMEADWKAFGRMFIKEILAMIIKLQALFVWQTLTGTVGTGGGGGSAVDITGSSTSNPMAVFGAPVGLATGGTVTKTGWAKVDKGEAFSGVNGEFGRANITINTLPGESAEVEEGVDGETIIHIVRQALASDGPTRRMVKQVARS